MLAQRTVSGSFAVDIPQLVSGDLALIDNTCRKNTTIAEAERPSIALYVEVATDATDGSVLTEWVAEEPDDEPILVVGFNPQQYPRSVVDVIVARRHGVPVEVEVLTLSQRPEQAPMAEDEAPVTWQDYEACITGTATIPLSGQSESYVLTGEIGHWPVQPATAESPAFPATTDISIGVAGTFLEMTPEKALAFAPKFGEFERAVTELAKQAIAERDGGTARAVPRPWTETVRGGGTVGGVEPTYCQGHPESKYPQHMQDVAHASKQIGLTAQCVDGPLGVLMAYITERPYDTTTALGSGPKLLLTPDEEHETRVLDVAGARKLAVDVRAWLTDFEALVEQMGTTEADLAAGGGQ